MPAAREAPGSRWRAFLRPVAVDGETGSPWLRRRRSGENGQVPQPGQDLGEQAVAGRQRQDQVPGVADEPGTDGDEPPPQGSDQRRPCRARRRPGLSGWRSSRRSRRRRRARGWAGPSGPGAGCGAATWAPSISIASVRSSSARPASSRHSGAIRRAPIANAIRASCAARASCPAKYRRRRAAPPARPGPGPVGRPARGAADPARPRGSPVPSPRSAASGISVSAQLATCGRPARWP
jgi:hypothetical protein